MNIIKKILGAIIGYSGSSEDPAKMSARFTAVIITVISTLVSYGAMAGLDIPGFFGIENTEQIQLIGGVFGIVAGCIYWLYGLIRAIITAVKTKNIGALCGM